MRRISTTIVQTIRNIKTRKQAKIGDGDTELRDKVKFTEEELTEMGQYRMKPNSRHFKDLFKEKLEEKYQKQQMGKQQTEHQNEFQEQQRQDSKPTPKMQKKSKQAKREQLKTFKIYKHKEKVLRKSQQKQKQRLETSLETETTTMQRLAKVRLIEQYLPFQYMKRVQKIFHKYDQRQMRDIAFNFTNLMKLRYSEEKINYDAYPTLNFEKLEEKLPFHRRVQQIHLIGKEKMFEDKEESRKVEAEPIEPEIKYSQNIVVSYLLNRVPRTYSVAYRVLNQIKNMFQEYRPQSFMDFGAGLSSGSAAFTEIYGDTGSVYSVEPAGKMRKLAKFLTDYSKIVHFQSLAELSSQVRKVDIAYCGYVLNEIRPQLITVYLESLYAKVKNHGFLAIVEYGNPFGARIIHEARKWALTKNIRIVAPCPHHFKCPLANSKHWCHFDQPTGMYPRQVFGKLPSDNSIKLQKFSYIIIQKLDQQEPSNEAQKLITPNITHQWDRVLYPLIRRGQHFIFTLCTKSGYFEKRIVGKSHGQQYKLGRKLRWGDFWRYGKRIPNRYRKQRKTGRRLW